MNELDFRKSFETMMQDNAGFDNFATQFVKSLVDKNTPEAIYWHGRLIGFGADSQGDWQPYTIRFFGNTYTEHAFRSKLLDGTIDIKKFELINASYAANAGANPLNLDAQIVTCTANIEATIDGDEKTGEVCLTFYIRRVYLSYDTEIDDCPRT